MPAPLRINIADVHFNLLSKHPVIFNNLPYPYKPFLEKKIFSDGKININIVFEPNNIHKTGNMEKIFETGNSWSMYRSSNEYLIVMNPQNLDNTTAWTVRFGHDIKSAVINCSEMLINKTRGKTSILCPLIYPLDQLLLMYILSDKEGALFHAAGLNLNGKGYIFPGRSGAGKSTLSRQFSGAKNCVMLSDDRVIVRKAGDSFRVFGTPWPGEEGIAENKSARLKGIFFISHGIKNTAKDLRPVEALKRLMPVTSIPWFDRDVMPQILNFCEELVSNIPAYQLYFNPDTEVADFLDKFSAS